MSYDSQKYAVISFLGGATLWFIQRIVRQNYIKIQKEVGKIQNKPVLQINQLEHVLQKNQEYGKLLEQNNDFLVEGKVQSVNGIPQLLSEDQLQNIVLANRSVYDLNLVINTDTGISDKRKVHTQNQIRTTPSFRLIPRIQQDQNDRNVYVEGFQNVITLPGVLDYSCKKEKLKPLNVQEQIQKIIDHKNQQAQNALEKQKMTDQERAAALEKEKKDSSTNIQTLNIGVIFEENSLTIGSPLLIYGKAIFDPVSRNILMASPQFFAKDKQQIISYLNDQIFWSKVFEFFLVLGIVVSQFLNYLMEGCGYYFAKKVTEILQRKNQKYES